MVHLLSISQKALAEALTQLEVKHYPSRAGEINAIPKQENVVGNSKADPLADMDISDMSVEEIADEIGKTVRGVKTMLTKKRLTMC